MRRAKPVCNFNSNRRQRTWQKKINLKHQQHRLPPVPRPPVLAAANVAVVLVAVAAAVAVAVVVVAAASAVAVVVAVPVQVATVMVRPATK